MSRPKRRKPARVPWRIAAGLGTPREPRVELHSADYALGPFPKTSAVSKQAQRAILKDARAAGPRVPHRAVFDELVISPWFHLEQMSTRMWWLKIGEDMVMITVGRNGKPKLGEWYR